jgi:hypothetical protein
MDAIVGSLYQIDRMPAGIDRWVFIDSRFPNLADNDINTICDTYGVKINRYVCDKWNEVYREQRTPIRGILPCMEAHETSSDEFGHRHMSSGLHALVYTCFFKRPDKITLVGYDNVRDGSFTWSLARGKDWNKYPDHRWDVENKLVPQIAESFGVEVVFR